MTAVPQDNDPETPNPRIPDPTNEREGPKSDDTSSKKFGLKVVNE